MCMHDDPSVDMPEFCGRSNRKARKDRKCSECFRTIKVGETYEYMAGKWDGRLDTFSTCQHCLVAREWLVNECGGYVFGGVKEDLRQHWEERSHYRRRWGRDMLKRLAGAVWGMRRKWTRLSGELMAVMKAG